ncbi:class II peroxidase, partial [Patellaria atrata CBS 101060]
ASCPAVWKTISDDELTPIFRSFLNCTDLALQAIRLAFHDCFAGAGCDGSLINAEEWRQPQNQGLETISKKLKAIAEKHNVGKADMIQFAGSHAIITCPLGVVGKTWVGRTDSSIQAPGTDLPDHTAPAQSLLDKFVAKGFTATDLAALLGAHSTARQRFVDPSKAGAAFDATPGQWDVTYYGQVTTQTANFNLDSDLAISRLPSVLPSWTLFTVDQVGWSLAFVAAWQKLTVLGIPGGTSSLIDCTNSLP